MERKIALLIIYNHRYDKNIPILDELFKDKFSYVYHIVPFYDGERKNVLPVYESSYYFSGYIAQALNQIRDKSFTHYVFTSDDLMLNPKLNENNIIDELGLNNGECFLPRFRSLQDPTWARSLDALSYKPSGLGAEIKSVLPSFEEAETIFFQKGFKDNCRVQGKVVRAILKKQIRKPYNWYIPADFMLRTIKNSIKAPFGYYQYKYPLVGGYNDFFIIDSNSMLLFKNYCGAFAASRLFVEIAIPTAMVLSASNVKTHEDTKYTCGDLWYDDIKELESKYNYDLHSLLSEFPSDTLYIHPVKLSKWK